MKTIPLKRYNMLMANFELLTYVLENGSELMGWLKARYPNEYRKAEIE
jgi:hypothetical protein